MDAFGDNDGRYGMVSGLCGRWPRTTAAVSGPLHSPFTPNFDEIDEDAAETFTAGVRRIWHRPTSCGSLAKDLPRLARRVSIRTRTGRNVVPPGPANARAMGPLETWALIVRLATTLVLELEPQRSAEVKRGLVEIAAGVTATTDLELVVPKLIQLLGGDSKALRALKMVDQGVMLLGVHHMKGGVTRGLLTKDVRSADGWQIGIDIFEHVQVYHKRREQSVDDIFGGANNHFELDFEVRATFDHDMAHLTAAGLRVQRLYCAPTMQPEMRMQLESRIPGDLILV